MRLWQPHDHIPMWQLVPSEDPFFRQALLSRLPQTLPLLSHPGLLPSFTSAPVSIGILNYITESQGIALEENMETENQLVVARTQDKMGSQFLLGTGFPLGFLFFNFFIWLHHKACGILVQQAGIEPALPEVEAWSLNHWTSGEVPGFSFGIKKSSGTR